jgi:hypothetical protein
MSPDRTPTSSTLDPGTVEALRAMLGRSAAQGKHEPQLDGLLCSTAREARDKGIRAEQLLIILKDIWYSLPGVAARTASDVDHALLEDLVSHCIREYYAL